MLLFWFHQNFALLPFLSMSLSVLHFDLLHAQMISLSHTHTLTHSLVPTLSLSLSVSHSIVLSLSLSFLYKPHSNNLSLSLSLSLTHTHTHTHVGVSPVENFDQAQPTPSLSSQVGPFLTTTPTPVLACTSSTKKHQVNGSKTFIT